MWEYRVYEGETRVGRIYSIFETYHNEEGEILNRTMEPVYPFGETPEELREDLELMLKAFEKPVLPLE